MPEVAGIIREVSDEIEIEVSTIARVGSIQEMKTWKDRYAVNGVCCDIHKNRDIGFLESFSRYCGISGLKLTLLANEFCGNGINGGESTSAGPCIYRAHCFNMHSLGYEKGTVLPHMENCISSLRKPSMWLKTNFIRPEDLPKYRKLGINNFKISGRAGIEFARRVVGAYLKESFDGNLLELFRPYETPNDKTNSVTYRPIIQIPNNKLDGFVDYWFENENRRCDTQDCGETCRYCDKFAKNIGLE